MSLSTSVRRRRETIRALSSKAYRDAYVGQHIKRGIASQIRALREARGWTQGELARQTDKAQPVISGLENPDYGSYTLSTLKRLASAFDVALVVRFVPFSDLVAYTSNISATDLAPPSFETDKALALSSFPTTASTLQAATHGRGTARRHIAPEQLSFPLPTATVVPIAPYLPAGDTTPTLQPIEPTRRTAGGYR